MVVFTDPWKIYELLDAVFLQDLLCSDTGALENSGRSKGTTRNNYKSFCACSDYLQCRSGGVETWVLDVLYTNSTLAPMVAVNTLTPTGWFKLNSLEDNTLDEVSGDDRNIFTFLVVQIIVRSIGPLTVLADPLLPAL